MVNLALWGEFCVAARLYCAGWDWELSAHHLNGARIGAAALAATLACSVALPAHAITINEHVPTNGLANYWDSTNIYSMVANIMAEGGDGKFYNSCTGSLINWRTVLTAGHCITTDGDRTTYGTLLNGTQIISFDADTSNKTSASGAVDSNISGMIAHETWRNAADSEVAAHSDLALLSLSKPITSIDPAVLFDGQVPLGTEVIMVGYGTDATLTATGLNILDEDGRRRVAHNIFDYREGDKQADQRFQIFYDVDNPNLANVDTFAAYGGQNGAIHVLEGSAAKGDSGGPMFAYINGELRQIGATHGGLGLTDNEADGSYTDIGRYVELFHHLSWISANDPLRVSSWKGGDGNWSDGANWSNGVPLNRAVACNGDKNNCARQHYYHAKFDAAGNVDLNTNENTTLTIDRFTITHDQAKLTVRENRTLETILDSYVNGGELSLFGTVKAPTLEVGVGGLLTGDGTIDGNLKHSGTLELKKHEELSVSGNATFESGSKVSVALDPSIAGELKVAGSATINGGTVEADVEAGIYNRNTSYTVISTLQGVTGTFDNASSTIFFMDAALAYEGNDIVLTLTREFQQENLNPRHNSLAAALNNLNAISSGDARDLLDELAGLSAAEVDRAMEVLGGGSLVQGALASITNARSISSVVSQVRSALAGGSTFGLALASFSPEEDTTSQNGFFPQASASDSETIYWMKGLVGWAQYQGAGSAFDSTVNTQGLLAGVAQKWDTYSEFGLFAGFSQQSSSQGNDSSSSDNYNFGFHFKQPLNDGWMAASVSYSYQETDSKRSVAIGAVNATATADYPGHAISLGATFGRDLSWDAATVTPFVGGDLLWLQQDGYTESGAGAANLTVATNTDTIAHIEAGAGIKHSYNQGAWEITPELKFSLRAELTDPVSSLNSTLAGQSFTMTGAERERLSGHVQIGVSAQNDDGLTVEVNYAGLYNEQFNDHTLGLRLAKSF